jgi:hypothetical protein
MLSKLKDQTHHANPPGIILVEFPVDVPCFCFLGVVDNGAAVTELPTTTGRRQSGRRLGIRDKGKEGNLSRSAGQSLDSACSGSLSQNSRKLAARMEAAREV